MPTRHHYATLAILCGLIMLAYPSLAWWEYRPTGFHAHILNPIDLDELARIIEQVPEHFRFSWAGGSLSPAPQMGSSPA